MFIPSKNITLLLLFFLLSAVACAQLKKGAFLVGLDASYKTSTQEFYNPSNAKLNGSVKSINFSLTPTIGYFVSNRLLVGFSATTSITNNNDTFHGYVDLSPKTVDGIFTLYARHYTKASDKVWFFLQGEMTWGGRTITTAEPGPNGTSLPLSENSHFFRTGIRPGVVYFLTPRLGLESTVGFFGYERSYASNDPFATTQKNIANSFELSFSGNVNFGFRFYLAKRESKG